MANEAQTKARVLIQHCMDPGKPCDGLCADPANPDSCPICGHDGAGQYHTHIETDGPSGPIAWEKLGTLGIGWVEVYGVGLCERGSDEVVGRDALKMAWRFAEGPPEWTRPDARSGLVAFAAWAGHLKSGEALLLHHDSNLRVWLDCREAAVAFLPEAKSRLGKSAKH